MMGASVDEATRQQSRAEELQEWKEGVEREVQLVAGFLHDNVVQYYGVQFVERGPNNMVAHLFMPYYRGVNGLLERGIVERKGKIMTGPFLCV